MNLFNSRGEIVNHSNKIRWRSMLSDYRRNWRGLTLTDLSYKVIAFALLTPLAATVFRGFVAISGRDVLADKDIMNFFLHPIGWGALIAIGALTVAILATEQAALMAIVHYGDDARKVTVRQALLFAGANFGVILRVTVRMVLLAILVTLPFLAVAGLTYYLLLTKFDINFYLSQRPPEFLAAVGIGAALGAGLVAVLVKLIAGWAYVLPLALFEDVPPGYFGTESPAHQRTATADRQMDLDLGGVHSGGFVRRDIARWIVGASYNSLSGGSAVAGVDCGRLDVDSRFGAESDHHAPQQHDVRGVADPFL